MSASNCAVESICEGSRCNYIIVSSIASFAFWACQISLQYDIPKMCIDRLSGQVVNKKASWEK